MSTTWKHITLFLMNGNTLRFHQVTEFMDASEYLYFKYVSASDDSPNQMVVYKDNIVAIAKAT